MYLLQHAHIENIKTVANLTNNKDVFMCILRFHARAGYLQHYETLLKEIDLHPTSDALQDEPGDQYEVDRNLNVPCESGIRYPSLVAMHNRQLMTSRITVIYSHIYVHTATNIVCTGIY